MGWVPLNRGKGEGMRHIGHGIRWLVCLTIIVAHVALRHGIHDAPSRRWFSRLPALAILLLLLACLLPPAFTPYAAPPPATFTSQQAFSVGTAPAFAAIADFNGDGKPDIVTVNMNDSTVSVLLNTTPTGPAGARVASFANQQTFAVGYFPFFLAVADVNGDGKPDIIVPNNSDSTVSVLLNTTPTRATTVSFAAPVIIPLSNSPASMAVADVNGDGKPDLIVPNHSDNTVGVLLNTTPAGATTPTFATQQTFAAGYIEGIAVADVDGDGKPDIVTTNSDNTVSVLRNLTPTGATTLTFATRQAFATDSPGFVTVVDVNGDGKPDIIMTSGNNTVIVLLNTTPTGMTTLTFATRQAFATGRRPNSVVVVDVNGDGKPDIIVPNEQDSTVGVLLNTTATGATTPTFAAQQTFNVGANPYSVAVVDLNGDGAPDLVVPNQGDYYVSVLINTIIPLAPITLSPASPLPSATVGVPYSATFTASGGTGTGFTYSFLSSMPPPGLSPTDNTLTGTPTQSGTYSFTITASDNGGDTGRKTYTLTIVPAGTPLLVSPLALGATGVNAPYSHTITATGGTAPYRFVVTSGTPPPGLMLATNGVLSGTPTMTGSFSFTVTATDSTSNTGMRQYTLVVAVPDAQPPGSRPSAPPAMGTPMVQPAPRATAPPAIGRPLPLPPIRH